MRTLAVAPREDEVERLGARLERVEHLAASSDPGIMLRLVRLVVLVGRDGLEAALELGEILVVEHQLHAPRKAGPPILSRVVQPRPSCGRPCCVGRASIHSLQQRAPDGGEWW